MTPKSTSAAESMLARTGRRMAVSESFIRDSFPRKVNRPDSPQRNGTFHARVPSLCCQYVETERGKSTLVVPFPVRSGARTYTEARESARAVQRRERLTRLRMRLGGLAEWLRHRS